MYSCNARANGFRFAGFCELCYVTREISPIPLEINKLPPHEPWLTMIFFPVSVYQQSNNVS